MNHAKLLNMSRIKQYGAAAIDACQHGSERDYLGNFLIEMLSFYDMKYLNNERASDEIRELSKIIKLPEPKPIEVEVDCPTCPEVKIDFEDVEKALDLYDRAKFEKTVPLGGYRDGDIL